MIWTLAHIAALKRIGFFFVDNWKVILIIIVTVIAFGLVFNFAFCGKVEKPIDNQQLNEYIEKQREKDTKVYEAQENRTESVVSNVQKRDAETRANVNKSKGISGSELDKLAKENQ